MESTPPKLSTICFRGTNTMSIVGEAPGFLQVLSDGSVRRFAPEIAPPSSDPSPDSPFISKDVILDIDKPITARIFLPGSESLSDADHLPLLPVLVYFHGGGFCIGSTTWLGYHHFLGRLAATAQTIIVSIDYRLAPENRLPAAYDDCFYSLEWVKEQVDSKSEPWLVRADLSRVFLSGDSAGANISHNVALRAIRRHNVDDPHALRIKGLLLVHPYFGSEGRTRKEASEGAASDVAMNDMFWRLSIPKGENRDYFGCNLERMEGGGVSAAEWRRFPAVVVYVAGLDFLKERGEMYVEFVKRKGVEKVSLVEEEREGHVYHVFDPISEVARALRQQMTHFINTL